MLDRLLHHAETVIIEGKSYRMKDQIETPWTFNSRTETTFESCTTHGRYLAPFGGASLALPRYMLRLLRM